MKWIRVQSNFYANPKIARLTPGAGWALVRVWCYCGDHETGGLLPASGARVVGLTRRQAAELEAAGLLHRNGDGWAVHDWDDYQPDAADLEERREDRRRQWREAQRRRRARRADA